MKKESPLFWPVQLNGNGIDVLDETALPFRHTYVRVTTTKEAVYVIRQMKTRAFGQFLLVLNTFVLLLRKNRKASAKVLLNKIRATANALNRSRPTFPFAEVTGPVVQWAQEAEQKGTDLASVLIGKIEGYLFAIRRARLKRIKKIAALIRTGDTILTHCNVSGELAMAAELCLQKKKKIRFFATETRPYFQGSRLTAWELSYVGADVTVVPDNAVGSLIADGLISKVIVGSDRSCANGDIANKVGTYQIAVLAKEYHIPFYVLTQPSRKIKRGEDIPIEVRDSRELLTFAGKRIAPKGVEGFYPGFDIVPHTLITKSIPIDPSGGKR